MRSPPPRIQGLGRGNCRTGRVGDGTRYSNVPWGGRQMVDLTSHEVVYLKTGGVSIGTINHLSYRERCSPRTSSSSP